MTLLNLYAGFKLLKGFFTALPDLITLVRVVQTAIENENTDRKVKTDIKAIHEAFTKKDAEALNRIFNSK